MDGINNLRLKFFYYLNWYTLWMIINSQTIQQKSKDECPRRVILQKMCRCCVLLMLVTCDGRAIGEMLNSAFKFQIFVLFPSHEEIYWFQFQISRLHRAPQCERHQSSQHEHKHPHDPWSSKKNRSMRLINRRSERKRSKNSFSWLYEGATLICEATYTLSGSAAARKSLLIFSIPEPSNREAY